MPVTAPVPVLVAEAVVCAAAPTPLLVPLPGPPSPPVAPAFAVTTFVPLMVLDAVAAPPVVPVP